MMAQALSIPSSALLLVAFFFIAGFFPDAAAAAQTVSYQDAVPKCPCDIAPLPDLRNKELTARWMVHSLDWGVLSTISSRLPNDNDNDDDDDDKALPIPFGNVYSFVDGPCGEGKGIPYFYGTYMDQSFKDSLNNANAALTLSEASLSSVCINSEVGQDDDNNVYKRKACQIGFGDPENPVCARLTLTGKFVKVTDPNEKEWAKQAILDRHASMKEWPDDHEWVVAKLELTDIWLIDYYGGAAIIDLEDYFNANQFETGGGDVGAEIR